MSDSTTHSPSIGELEAEVDAVDDPGTLTGAEREEFATTLVALADAYGRRGTFETEADTIERLTTLCAETDVAETHLATALVNATAVADRAECYETGLDLERLTGYRERLETLAEDTDDLECTAALADATAQLAHAAGKAEHPDRIPPLVADLADLASTHDDPAFAAALALGHAYAERYLDGDGDRLERVEALYEEYSTDSVASGLAGVIAGRTNADAPYDLAAIEDRIARIEELAARHPDADVTRWLPIATTNATRASFEAADYERLEHWGGETLAVYEQLETPTSATWAAAALFYSARGSFFEGDVGKGERKLEQLEDLQARYENPIFDHWLARSMFDAVRSYAETGHYEEARDLADELTAYAEGHDEQAQIEAGLESLREQAPGLFGKPEHAAEEPTAAAGDDAHAGSDPDDESRTITIDATEALEHAATLEDAEESGGCGSCGSGGCGSCGTQKTVEPASDTTLIAMGAVLTLLALAVGYAGYRLINRFR